VIFIEVRCDKCGSVGLSRRCFHAPPVDTQTACEYAWVWPPSGIMCEALFHWPRLQWQLERCGVDSKEWRSPC
jgi:hypothetical protein